MAHANLTLFLDSLRILERFEERVRHVNNIGIITMSGTYAVLTSDLIEATNMKLPQPNNTGTGKIYLTNPLDMWPLLSTGRTQELQQAIRQFLKTESIDVFLIILFGEATFDVEGFANILTKGASPKPIVAGIISHQTGEEWARVLDSHGIPSFVGIDAPMRIVAALQRSKLIMNRENALDGSWSQSEGWTAPARDER